MPAAASAPTRLDIRAFAQGGRERAGSDPLEAYPRLAEEARGPTAGRSVQWKAVGSMHSHALGAPQPWLHLQADAVLPMTCQRCLEVVEVPLAVDQRFRFVADEATAEAEDDEAEEDVLAVSEAFDLHALIEDELILSMPLIAMHETCPAALPGADAETPVERPHPFAALEQLRKPRDGAQ